MIWLHIILNALVTGAVAGAMASMVSLGIEKLGGSLGGILGGTPSTIVPAVIGLWLTIASSDNLDIVTSDTLTQQEVVDFQKCMFMTPSGMLLNGLFLYSWRIVPGLILRYFPWLEHRKYAYLLMIISAALSFWFCVAVCLVFLNNFLASGDIPLDEIQSNATSTTFIVTSPSQRAAFFVAISFMTVHLCWGVGGNWNAVLQPKASNPTSWKMNLLRALVAGTVVFIAVIVSKLDPIVGGIAVMFPAVFSTVMISVWLNSGSAVSLGAVEPLIISSVAVSVFSMSIAFILPTFALTSLEEWQYIICALLTAFTLCVVCASIPVFLYMQWRMRVNSGGLESGLLGHSTPKSSPPDANRMSELDESSELAEKRYLMEKYS